MGPPSGVSSRYVRAALEFGLMVGGRGLALVATLIYIRVTAEYLGKAEYGLLAIIAGIANTLYVVLGSPLNLPITRIVNENDDKGGGLRRLVSRYSAWSIVAAAATSLIIGLVWSTAWPHQPLPVAALAAIPLFVAFYIAFSVINSAFVAWRARGITSSTQCGLAWLRLLLTLPLIWLAVATPANLFVVSALAFVPILVVQLILLRRHHPDALDRVKEFPKDLVTRYWSLVRQHAPQVWINASIFFVDKPLFALVLPLEQVAVYTIIQQIARALSSLFIEMGVQFLMPYAFRGATSGSRLHVYFAASLPLASLLIGLLTYLAGDRLVAAIASEKYAGIDPLVLGATAFGVCLSFAVSALELKGFAAFSVGRYMIAHVVQAVVFLIGGLLAATVYGLPGIIACLVAAVLLRAAAVLAFNRRHSKVGI